MMRGLAERGASDIINRLACGVFGIELEVGGYPSPMVDVEATRLPYQDSRHRWRVVVSTQWKPWTMLGGELIFYGKTKGDALGNAATFLHSIHPEPEPKP